MKRLILFCSLLLLVSCGDSDYKYIGQEIIDGKVSAVEKSKYIGRSKSRPIIWVQDARHTESITIPYEYENRWKVGDNCLLIIEKYEIVKKDK